MTRNTWLTHEPDFAQRAAAFAEAGQAAQAVRFYRLAGEAAVAAGQYEMARTHISQALALVPDSQPELRYALLLARAAVLRRSGDHDLHESDLVSLSTLANSLDDDRLRAEVAAYLAEYKLLRGDFQDAISIVQLGTRLAQLAAAERELALLDLVWGQALLRQGAYAAAGGKLRAALARAEMVQWPRGTADSQRLLGVLALEQNEFVTARRRYAAALALYRELGDQPGQADALNNLANVAHAQGDFGAARAHWEAAKPISQAIGDRVGLCRILVSQSAITIDTGDYSGARQHLEEALALSWELEMPFGEALINLNLALALHYHGEQAMAREHGLTALTLAQKMRSRRLEGYALAALGKVLASQDEPAGAVDYFWQALALWQELAQPNLAAEAHAGLARAALAAGDQPGALAHAEAILTQLNADASLAGTDSPIGVYLTCYQVLAAAQDERAPGILRQAHDLLQQRAAAIQDEALRQSFLQRVAVHRELAALFRAAV